jgi:hypothetical protein
MKLSKAFIVGAVIGSLFTACPKHEVTNSKLPIQIQGYVYDNLTKQPVADSYVGLRIEFFREPYGQYAQEELAKTATDKNGFYILQCSLDNELCQGAKLYLYPAGSTGVYDPGIRIQCTDNLQTIDLYK